MPETFRVLVAGEDQLVRAGIRLVLAQSGDIRVVAEASNSYETVELTLRYRPQVVLIDTQLSNVDELVEIQELIRVVPKVAVIVLTSACGETKVVEALAHGAAGFLLKDSAAEELPQAIRAVARGQAFLSPAVTRQVLDRLSIDQTSYRAEAVARLEVLSGRERDVLALLAQGMSNADISQQLWISEATVKTHVSRVLTKLDCGNRVQVAIVAHEAGLSQSGRVG